jgi:hypothetical protein
LRFLRNISFTFAECSINKTEFHKNLAVQQIQSSCRFSRYPILSVFPEKEYLNNGKSVREARKPMDLSIYQDKCFGALYMSCDEVDEDWLKEAHRVSRRVYLCVLSATGPGDWVALTARGGKTLYEHRFPRVETIEP